MTDRWSFTSAGWRSTKWNREVITHDHLRLNAAYGGRSVARERLRFPLQLSQEIIHDLLKPFLVREIHGLETNDAMVVDDVDRRPGMKCPILQ